jgi:hypothetical protein
MYAACLVYILLWTAKSHQFIYFSQQYIYIYIYFDIFCCEKLLCVFHSNIYLRRMAPTALPLDGFKLLFYDFFFFFIYLCFLGFGFPSRKASVFRIVLSYLLIAVIFLDSNSVFTFVAIFWWLMQVSSRDVVGLVLICFPFTFETSLCGPFKGPGHLFVYFPTFCIYFSTVSVWFESNIEEPTHFSLIRLPTSSFSFRIGRENDYLL